MIRLSNFIDGAHVAPLNQKYFPSLNPATEDVHVEVPRSEASDVVNAVAAAKAAFPGWSERRAEVRADFLDKIADGIVSRAEELARAESLDQGKPMTLAASLDIPRAAQNFRFFAGVLRHELSIAAPMDRSTFSYVRREPIGVAGLISPWNLPVYLLTWKIAPAIGYGNTCVVKPSEMTSHTAFILSEIIRDAGLPRGVVNFVFGFGSEAGQALVEHKDVPLISFTGGTVTGRKISETVAPLMKKLSLELGGKNPTIVFKDVNLKKHLKMIVRSAFLNQGEICLCGSRIYVEREIFESFTDAFVKEAKELVVGDPLDKATFMGPLVSKDHFEKVQSFVSEAKAQGLRVLTGGGRPENLKKGFYFAPTVLTPQVVGKSAEGVASEESFHAAKIQTDEVFGPVVTISPFDSENEVIGLANSTKYGLSASLWTDSLSKAHGVAARLHAGTVWVNTWMTRDLRMPFGGVKESGLGREGQLDSVHFFTEAKTVCIRHD